MNEEKFDDLLRDLMQESGLERAPSNLTQQVMAAVTADLAKPKRALKPIFSKGAWIGIAASVIAACIFAIKFLQPNGQTFPGQAATERLLSQGLSIFEQIQVPNVLVLSVAAIAILIGLERTLTRRTQKEA